jgi:hypothetical protein
MVQVLTLRICAQEVTYSNITWTATILIEALHGFPVSAGEFWAEP